LDLAIASANLSAREVLLLVVADVLAGIMNAVAGGGARIRNRCRRDDDVLFFPPRPVTSVHKYLRIRGWCEEGNGRLGEGFT
jgi:hypothetical protein